jgi:hypothetical protein
MSASCGGSPVPEGLWHEKENKEEAECNNDRYHPENPSPSERLDDGRTDERNNVLATQEQKCVNAKAVGSLMEEEDLRHSC